MNNGDEKRARIIAEQASRQAEQVRLGPPPSARKPRRNWAASTSFPPKSARQDTKQQPK